jgi:hypothetical protein
MSWRGEDEREIDAARHRPTVSSSLTSGVLIGGEPPGLASWWQTTINPFLPRLFPFNFISSPVALDPQQAQCSRRASYESAANCDEQWMFNYGHVVKTTKEE